MTGKWTRKARKWAAWGALLGGATAFNASGAVCDSSDVETLLALAALASAAANAANSADMNNLNQIGVGTHNDGGANTQLGDGSVRFRGGQSDQITDGASNTLLVGEGGSKR